MYRYRSIGPWWLSPVLAALLPGCGGSNDVPVSLKLLQGGKPYAPPSGQRVVVALHVIEARDAAGKPLAAEQAFPASFNPDGGSFLVAGPSGTGIPPGKYRVSIFQGFTREGEAKARQDPASRGRGKPAVDRDTDLLKDLFGPTTSPVVCEVKEPCELAIDLDAEMPAARKEADERARKAKQAQQASD